MINILIADDHEIFIDGLNMILKTVPDINIKGTAKNGLEVIEKLKQSDYDIVLLDISMPEMNGVECARKIRKLQIKTKVLILSQFGDKKLVDKLIKLDIEGYLLKSTPKPEIITAIREVYNNNKYFSKEIRPNYFIKKSMISRYDFTECNFSKREKQVLGFICQGKTNSKIAIELNRSIHSVETFRQRIMKKSGMHNTAELVRWVVENDVIDLTDL